MVIVGMDVHVRNSYVHATDEAGRVLRRGRCANRMRDVAELLSPAEKAAKAQGGGVRVVLESTTNSRAIQRLLTHYGREAGIDLTAEVLDARKLRVIAESVSKCDRLDAAVLNELARSNLKLPACYMPDDEEFALREHLRARHDLVRMRTMVKNRIHALLHRRGILAPSAGLFTKAGQAFLDQVELDKAGRVILMRFLGQLEQLDGAIAESTESLRALMREPRWAKPAALLQTMPGIGLITSLMILAELGDLRRFRSRAAVANYAGLVPIGRDSDTKCYRGGITHRGSQHLRAVLVEAAWFAIQRVPVYSDLFARVHRKKNKPTAIVAVARRMLEDGWTMLKRDEAFRYVAPPVVEAPASESRCNRKVASGVAG
jgi:transposase